VPDFFSSSISIRSLYNVSLIFLLLIFVIVRFYYYHALFSWITTTEGTFRSLGHSVSFYQHHCSSTRNDSELQPLSGQVKKDTIKGEKIAILFFCDINDFFALFYQ